MIIKNAAPEMRPKLRKIKHVILTLAALCLIAAPGARAQTLIGEGTKTGNEGRPGLGFFPDLSIAYNPLLPPQRIYLTALDNPTHLLNLFDYFLKTWLPTFITMAHEFSLVMMHQAAIVGTFIDAKNQLETQLTLQKIMADASRRYQTDEQMCVIGTNTRSLAASSARSRANAAALSKALTDRQSASSLDGTRAIDIATRVDQMKAHFCDPHDSGGHFIDMCKARTLPGVGSPSKKQLNDDINFTRTLSERYTLDLDFTNDTPTEDEMAVLGLLRNLFAHRTFKRMSPDYAGLVTVEDDAGNIRSVNALRSVVLNSFSNMIAMKAAGGDDGKGKIFMKPLLKQLGYTDVAGEAKLDKEIDDFLGANPSYYAQMEVLTNKMYQNPNFYTNLYARPENVARASAAMQAIKLMHDRDRYESALRREMMISLLLEMKLREHQETVTDYVMGGADFYVDP